MSGSGGLGFCFSPSDAYGLPAILPNLNNIKYPEIMVCGSSQSERNAMKLCLLYIIMMLRLLSRFSGFLIIECGSQ